MRALAGLLIVGVVLVAVGWLPGLLEENSTFEAKPEGESSTSVPARTDVDVAAPTNETVTDTLEPPIAGDAPDRIAALEQPRFVVRGRVIDGAFTSRDWAEQPAANVRVNLRGGDLDEDVTTNADGSFRLEFDEESRPTNLRALAYDDDRYRAAVVSKEIASDQSEVAIELRRQAWGGLSGTVVDVDGAPLSNARIVAWRSSVEKVETRSGPDGRFEFPDLRGAGWDHKAELAGYSLLWSTRLATSDEGGWRPVVITLAPTAAELVVRVVDTDRQPIEGVDVALSLAPEETPPTADRVWGHVRDTSFGGWGSGPAHAHRLRVRARTDELGRARFDQAWAERRIVVLVTAAGRTRTAMRRFEDRLVFGEGGQGHAIVLRRGETAELEARLRGALKLTGRVTYDDGRPADEATVEVTPVQKDASESFHLRRQTDAKGNYAIELTDVRPGERLLVRARDGSRFRPQSGNRHAGAEVLVEPDSSEHVRADLILEPALTITGRLVDSAGAKVAGWVVASAEPPVHPASLPQMLSTPSNDRFGIGGLGPGSYTLEVHRTLPFGSARQRFPGIQAGAQDLELVLDEPLDVQVQMRIVAPSEIGKMQVLLAIANDPERALEAPPAARQARTDASGWPSGACLDCSGGMPSTIAGAPYRSFIQSATPGSTHELEALPRDTLSFGIDASDAEGRPFAPVLLPPARYGAGTYEVEFRLRLSATLKGRVIGFEATDSLSIAIADAAGRLVVLADGKNTGDWTRALGTNGEFELFRIPAERVSLRIGTRAELLEGRSRLEQPLELEPNHVNTIEIALP